jgi:uracil-DNA glycosylase
MPAAPPARVPADLALAGDLTALRTLLDQFEGCALKATATKTVFGVGPADANLMIIGEAPGEEEDRRGEPFVGASGQLLDRMLAAIGLQRTSVYITNTIYWRPPGNRTPTPAEIQACLPFLQRQIALVQPRVLLLMGAAAAKAMLNRTEGIMRLRGRWFEYETGDDTPPIPTLATFHPAYLLRSPAQKREAWRDLQTLQNRLIESNS